MLDIPFIVSIPYYGKFEIEGDNKVTNWTNNYIIIVFSCMFCAMTFLLVRILQKISRLQLQARDQESSSALKNEKTGLIIVLIVFDLSFLLKVLLSATIFKKSYAGDYTNPFIVKMTTVAPAIFMDAVPIFCVLYLHH